MCAIFGQKDLPGSLIGLRRKLKKFLFIVNFLDKVHRIKMKPRDCETERLRDCETDVPARMQDATYLGILEAIPLQLGMIIFNKFSSMKGHKRMQLQYIIKSKNFADLNGALLALNEMEQVLDIDTNAVNTIQDDINEVIKNFVCGMELAILSTVEIKSVGDLVAEITINGQLFVQNRLENPLLEMFFKYREGGEINAVTMEVAVFEAAVFWGMELQSQLLQLIIGDSK